jgi:uncharacterized membrane protein
MRLLAPALTVAALIWALAIVGAPRVFASPAFGPVAAAVYGGSARICHQRADRSFETSGLQWPVCARCAGLYLSGAAGAVLGWIGLMGWSTSRARWLLGLAAMPTALTWTLEVIGVMAFSNTARAVAALPLGAAAGWLFICMLRYDSGLDARQVHSSRTSSLPG